MTSILSVLPEMFTGYEDESEPTVKEGWSIATIADADWALSRMAELEQEGRSVDEQARAAKERIDKRAALLKAKVERGVGFFRFRLLEYAQTHRGALLGGGKKKSRSFVHGTIGWKAKGGRLVVKDSPEEKVALETWLRTLPEGSPLRRVKYEPAMAEIQAAFKTTGVIPPGMDVEPEKDEPYVKTEPVENGLMKGGGNV